MDPGADRVLVVLFGPPAVGKMTVGRELERITGIPLFHNHMTIELVLPFFEFGSPPFSRLVGGFREAIFEEVARSDLPGLIFTWVWAFDESSDLGFISDLKSRFEDHGARSVFVELWAELETRLERNATPLRLEEKRSKRDVEASNRRLLDLDTRYRLTSEGDVPFDAYLRIDNTDLSPGEAAETVVEHFDLPRRDPVGEGHRGAADR